MSATAAIAASHLADGPAMYFGSSIMTFALPLGAFIVIALALFFLFRARHSGPRLKYLTSRVAVTAVITREPGPAPAPEVKPEEPVSEETPAEEEPVGEATENSGEGKGGEE